MVAAGVSDEVWSRLDPTAARLSRSTRVKLAGWVVVAAALTFGVLLLTASGLFIHRLSVSHGSVRASSNSCYDIVAIKNNGWFDERVVGDNLQPRGSGATAVAGLSGAIPSGGTRTIRIHYPESWCKQFFHSTPTGAGRPPAAALVLHLRRPWGQSSATVLLDAPPDHDGVTIHW